MPRDSNGDYELVSGNPVEPGTIIQSTWANTTMEDIAIALSDSLDRYGRGGMLAPFLFFDGSREAPGAAWANEPNTGLYRAGGGDLRMSVRANDVMKWENDNAFIWDNEDEVWRAILTQGGENGVASGTVEGQTLRWNNTSKRYENTSILRVLNNGNVFGLFQGSGVAQQSSKVEVTTLLPTPADPNTLYIVTV